MADIGDLQKIVPSKLNTFTVHSHFHIFTFSHFCRPPPPCPLPALSKTPTIWNSMVSVHGDRAIRASILQIRRWKKKVYWHCSFWNRRWTIQWVYVYIRLPSGQINLCNAWLRSTRISMQYSRTNCILILAFLLVIVFCRYQMVSGPCVLFS